MKEYGGWFFPDHEEHLPQWLRKVNDKIDGRLRYQGKKIDAALASCKNFRTALDIGAHVGLWSYYLASKFDEVHAFEPVPEHRECFQNNVDSLNVQLHGYALGDEQKQVAMHVTNTSSGDSWVEGSGSIHMMRLDDLGLDGVDFIKVDCEGYELPILRGGEELIKKCRPTVCVEQKPGKAQKFGFAETGAVEYLSKLGAVLTFRISGDYIFRFPD